MSNTAYMVKLNAEMVTWEEYTTTLRQFLAFIRQCLGMVFSALPTHQSGLLGIDLAPGGIRWIPYRQSSNEVRSHVCRPLEEGKRGNRLAACLILTIRTGTDVTVYVQRAAGALYS